MRIYLIVVVVVVVVVVVIVVVFVFFLGGDAFDHLTRCFYLNQLGNCREFFHIRHHHGIR